MLFVKNKDGTLNLYIDYGYLNKFMVNNKYSLPQIDDLFDKMRREKVFSKIDSKSRYHQARSKEEAIHKKCSIPNHLQGYST
jgi:hypothetical protein